ncbi:hypothetical protein ACOSQ3_033131 [Xanthoceras sorbifolium]
MEDSFTFSAQWEPRKMIEGLVMSSAGGGLRFDVLREEVDEILTNKATKGNNKVVKPSVMDVSKLTGKKVLTNISNRLKMKEVDKKYRPLTGGDLSGTGLVNEGKESDMEEVLEDSTRHQASFRRMGVEIDSLDVVDLLTRQTVTSTSGIFLHWSMPGLPREVRRSLTRYCPLWVVRGCPATTPSRFCFASPKSGFEPVTYP